MHMHLGHILHCKLEDDVDITRVTAAMCRQVNYNIPASYFCGCDMISENEVDSENKVNSLTLGDAPVYH